MKISHQYHGEIGVFSLKGRLDALGSQELENFLKIHLQPDEAAAVIEMAGVEYLSSAGIRILLGLEKKMNTRGGRILISGIQPYPLSVLEMTGFKSLFAMYPELDDALTAARSITGREGAATGDGGNDMFRIECRNAAYEITCTGGEPVPLWSTGSPGNRPDHPIREGMQVSVSASPGACSLGWGVPGRSPGVMGHLLTIGTIAAWMPPSGNGTLDYLLLDEHTTKIPITTPFIISSPGPAHLTGRMESGSGEGIPFSDFSDALSLIAFRMVPGYRGLSILSFSAETVSVKLHGDGSRGVCPDPNVEESTSTLIIGCAILADQERFPAHFSSSDAEALFHHPCGHPFALPRILCLVFPGLQYDEEQTVQDALAEALSSGSTASAGCPAPGTRIRRASFSVSVIADILQNMETRITIIGESLDLNPDYERIVRSFHPDCSEVILTPITGGFSGSRVFRDDPVDHHGRREMTFVLKLDRLANISAEIEGYTGHVRRYIQNNATQIIQHERSGECGGILYTFVGIKGPDSRISSLEDYYYSHPTGEVSGVIDRLFRTVLRAWYGQPLLRDLPLYEIYGDPYAYALTREWAISSFGISDQDETIDLPYGMGRSINPLYFFGTIIPERREDKWSTYMGSVHGDLHMKNVLMDEEENLWLIDFAFTTHSHILRDIAKLETVLKTEMIPINSEGRLLELLEIERAFLDPEKLSDIPSLPTGIDDPDIQKAYTIISQLRNYADRITLLDDDISQYYLALLYYTISIPAYTSVNEHVREYAWIIASLLCQKIRGGNRS